MTPETFDAEWARCAPWLQSALDFDPAFTLDQVKRLVLECSARYQFWPGQRSAVVTQIVDYPEYRDLHLWLAGGDFQEMAAGHPSAEAFARAAGCHRMTSFSRMGMTRRMAPLGYRPAYVAMVKEL